MEKAIDERRPNDLDDECEMIELGSVSEETKGSPGGASEFSTGSNSHPG